ncbi:MAG: PKD domain-containing protein, partial [Gammaproteobacteria bacterium]
MRKGLRLRVSATRGLLIAVLALAGAACGGGGGGGSTPPPASTNRAPVANAGADQFANVGVRVTLSGAASTDPDGDALTYSWTISVRPTGSQATLTGPTTASPSFTPDIGGNYTVSLSVSDGRLQDADTVAVTANAAPNAVAGPDQTVDAGSTVILDGRASTDPDGDAITYAWTLSRPNGSQAVLSDATASMPSFVAD